MSDEYRTYCLWIKLFPLLHFHIWKQFLRNDAFIASLHDSEFDAFMDAGYRMAAGYVVGVAA